MTSPGARRVNALLIGVLTGLATIVLAQMVGEVSLLHTFVYGGDRRPGTDMVEVASLGATWSKQPSLGGYKIERLYRCLLYTSRCV